MNPTLRSTIAAFLASLGPFAVERLAAQNVVLSEIVADGGDRWIELHNRGTTWADLSYSSLMYASDANGYPMDYWWPFPVGTMVAPQAFLRVHWYANGSGSLASGELYTGASPYGFLFGLGAVPLSNTRGAVGLLSTQLNGEMNSAAVFVDWVSWGAHGFQRENLAVQNGAWTANAQCPSIPAGQSLARIERAIGTAGTRDQEWFVDPSPTPLESNVGSMLTETYGQACTVLGHHLLGAPDLRTTAMPMLGSAQFGYAIDDTTGFFGESLLLAFGTAAAPAGLPSLLPPLPGPLCRESIDTRTVFATFLMPTHVLETRIPLSLAAASPALSGMELHAEAMVFDWLPNVWPPFQGVTNSVRVVLGQ